MSATQIKADGLRRELRVVVAQADIDAAVTERLRKLSREVKLPGFRPGKVPLKLVRNRFGDAVRGEVVENLINERSRSALEEHGLKPALPPEFEADQENAGEGDVAFKMNVDVLPEIPDTDFSQIHLERLTAPVSDESIDGDLTQLAETRRRYEPIEEARPAADGDLVVVDYRGTVDGEERPGMAAEDAQITLGQGRMIPGFENALAGLTPGEEKSFTVTFPEGYHEATLSGREAEFRVTLKEIRAPVETPLDDDWAKELGFQTLDEVKDALSQRRQEELGRVTRQRLKRSLLDRLAELHDFPVPDRMVDMDFHGIWHEVEHARERQQAGSEPADPTLDKPEDELKTEYRAIALRRVRLGLLLAEEGRRHNITVGDEDLQKAVIDEARRMPGREREVIQFYQEHKEALKQVRERLLEDKVVDFMLELIEIDDKDVTVEELLADPDDPAPAED